MMLLPLRNQPPLRPTFLHWQEPGGRSQMLQGLLLVCIPAAVVFV
jgi:hypothetical protein